MRVIGAIVSDYKSIGEVEVPLAGLTVLLGPNGAGKTNLIEAIGFHDPVARTVLSRGGTTKLRNARVGLVVTFDVDREGAGSDSETLRQMAVSPWAEGIDPREITDGIGAYCGSAWWLYGGDLYDPESQRSLRNCYRVIRAALMAEVPDAAVTDAGLLVDALLTDPVLIVQEDFKVELSCDRSGSSGRRITELAERVRPLLAGGALADLLGVFTSWNGRWPPLTAFTRGPGAGRPGTPAGFEWVAAQLGGVRVVNGDPVAVEQYLDRAVEKVHDHLFHEPVAGHDDSPEDLFCESCLHPNHAGRVDPSVYDSLKGIPPTTSLPILVLRIGWNSATIGFGCGRTWCTL